MVTVPLITVSVNIDNNENYQNEHSGAPEGQTPPSSEDYEELFRQKIQLEQQLSLQTEEVRRTNDSHSFIPEIIS